MRDGELELLPLRVGEAWLTIDARAVVEILGSLAWVPLPGAPSHAPGVIPWRGRAIALVDVGALAGIAPALERGEVRRRTVVASTARASIAIPVDAAREVHAVATSELTGLHAARARGARAEIALLGTVMPVIDLEAMVAELTGGA